ncbi:MAG: hypothetical protein GTN84_07585 [Hydrogenophaga sp.]|uniref:hypothetical protein n=1 Tax=Hydrogenophaga sp. TaxID=1904254 RepID=UPI001690CEF6|nr:hypothetical protein [Hydrogenophaga sp.]NIM40803.1 hypothetical protein [Hydrogenophaga sp.]NIN26278.1 hypothetical protein [Hydrogenophaga sp.]NIN31143.1 hypothetical protein [Hydrogenophaga sp.]NIN55186.1 hypothetical protein [Hydrogenophaga sp.]NIO51229.1 hypothetical protein [Hydrogenophaga sp.]
MKRIAQTPYTSTTQADQQQKSSVALIRTDPGGELARSQTLWDLLPREVAQKIVWYRSPLPSPGHESTLATRIELFRSLMVDRKLRGATQPLLRMARWSHEFTKYWPRPSDLPSNDCAEPDIETLVSNPVTPSGPDGSVDLTLELPNEYQGQARTRLLLSGLNAHDRPRFMPPLLTRMFAIWLERRHDTGAHAQRLPTDDLPRLLLHADTLLTPPLVYEAIGIAYSRLPLHTVSSAPVELLLQHFMHFDSDLQCTLALQLLLLLEDDDLQMTAQTRASLKRHGIDRHCMVEQAVRWKSGLLDTPWDQIDVQLGHEVLDFLKRTRSPAGMACIALLLRLCAVPHLRALESDETWIGLIQQAMAQISHQRPSVWNDTYRTDYLVAHLPEDLGVAAFKGLPAAQRLRFIRKPQCDLYFKARRHIPYLRALFQSEDIEPVTRLATLDHFIGGVVSRGAYDAEALPQLRLWRQILDDSIRAQELTRPEPRHAPV